MLLRRNFCPVGLRCLPITTAEHSRTNRPGKSSTWWFEMAWLDLSSSIYCCAIVGRRNAFSLNDPGVNLIKPVCHIPHRLQYISRPFKRHVSSIALAEYCYSVNIILICCVLVYKSFTILVQTWVCFLSDFWMKQSLTILTHTFMQQLQRQT